MKIIQGRWVDDNNNPVDNFNVSELLEIGEKVTAVYGKKITYDRINLISSIKKLTTKEEGSLTYLLNQKVSLSKLAGY
jgi:hypothetical protein